MTLPLILPGAAQVDHTSRMGNPALQTVESVRRRLEALEEKLERLEREETALQS